MGRPSTRICRTKTVHWDPFIRKVYSPRRLSRRRVISSSCPRVAGAPMRFKALATQRRRSGGEAVNHRLRSRVVPEGSDFRGEFRSKPSTSPSNDRLIAAEAPGARSSSWGSHCPRNQFRKKRGSRLLGSSIQGEPIVCRYSRSSSRDVVSRGRYHGGRKTAIARQPSSPTPRIKRSKRVSNKSC